MTAGLTHSRSSATIFRGQGFRVAIAVIIAAVVVVLDVLGDRHSSVKQPPNLCSPLCHCNMILGGFFVARGGQCCI